jgi:hypothetical protein
MGLAWGASPPLDLIDGLILILLSFSIINISSLIGAQANAIYDYKLDLKDDRKKTLIKALDCFGHKKVKIVLIIECLATLVLVSIFAAIQQSGYCFPYG